MRPAGCAQALQTASSCRAGQASPSTTPSYAYSAGIPPVWMNSTFISALSAPARAMLGSIKGGMRGNIIPDSVQMEGTIRTFDEGMRDDIHERVTYLAEAISRGSRAGCKVCINKHYPVTVNDPALTEAMLPTLRRVAGAEQVQFVPKVMGSEDFSFFQRVSPGLFIFLGVVPPGTDPLQAAPNHSPRFYVDERCLVLGVRALANLACDYLQSGSNA